MEVYMIKEMNPQIFSKFLDESIEEVRKCVKIEEGYGFVITPVVEKGKPMFAEDEMMRLNIINKKRVENRIFSKNEVVNLLTVFSPLVPIWIDVEYVPDYLKRPVFELKCSLRLRKPSLLRNQETGHPPFRVII